MNTEKVSIIIPVYNKEHYLERCFKSIEKQTYGNIEVVLIDDGSIDNSLELCNTYMKKTNYECILYHQENQGPSAARNMGLELSTGSYVIFLDADDSLVPECIDICVDHFDKFSCDFVEFGFKNSDKSMDKQSFDLTIIENDDILKNLLNGNYIKPVVCGAMYSRKLIKNIRFVDNIKWGEDSCFKLLVCMKSKKMIHIDTPLYINYLVPETLSRMKCNQEMLDSVDIFIRFYINTLPDKKMEKEVGRFVFNTAFSYISLIIIQNQKKTCEKGYSKMISYAKKYYNYADFRHKLAYKLMGFEKLYIYLRKIYNRK